MKIWSKNIAICSVAKSHEKYNNYHMYANLSISFVSSNNCCFKCMFISLPSVTIVHDQYIGYFAPLAEFLQANAYQYLISTSTPSCVRLCQYTIIVHYSHYLPTLCPYLECRGCFWKVTTFGNLLTEQILQTNLFSHNQCQYWLITCKY